MKKLFVLLVLVSLPYTMVLSQNYLSGKVTKVKGNLGVIDLGAENGVKENEIFSVFRYENGNKIEIGQIKIIQVLNDKSGVKVFLKDVTNPWKAGDFVERTFSTSTSEEKPAIQKEETVQPPFHKQSLSSASNRSIPVGIALSMIIPGGGFYYNKDFRKGVLFSVGVPLITALNGVMAYHATNKGKWYSDPSSGELVFDKDNDEKARDKALVSSGATYAFVKFLEILLLSQDITQGNGTASIQLNQNFDGYNYPSLSIAVRF